jgi:hypothetical protein
VRLAEDQHPVHASECRSANIVRDHAMILPDDATPKPDAIFGKDTCPVRGSSTRHRSDRGMRPQWRCPGSRIEHKIARPRVDSGRGGPECVIPGGTRQTLGRHCESLPVELRVRPDAGSPVRS